MTPETFNRLKNNSKEELDRFVDWLFSHTLPELRASRGDMNSTRAAWLHYFGRGLAADLLLDELMTHVPELFRRAQYPVDEARSVLTMLKAIRLEDIGVLPTERGAKPDGQVG